VIFSDVFLPSKRKLYWKKQRLATVDASTRYCGVVPAVRSSERASNKVRLHEGRSEVRAVGILAAHSRAQILWATPVFAPRLSAWRERWRVWRSIG